MNQVTQRESLATGQLLAMTLVRWYATNFKIDLPTIPELSNQLLVLVNSNKDLHFLSMLELPPLICAVSTCLSIWLNNNSSHDVLAFPD